MPTIAPHILRRAAALAGLSLALVPAAASADSIVFLKDHNVWLAEPDGSKLHQVTTDGSYERQYYSPSQADDGTIAVSRGEKILRMTQNGTILNELDPPPLMNSVSHPMDGVPVDVAISPDGSRIAYSFVSYECPVAAECRTRYATGYTAADRLTPPEPSGTTFFHNPSWVTSSRTLQFGGYGSQVNIHDVGTPEARHWFDDGDYAENSTDLGDGELNRQGTDLAVVRGYGTNTHIMWYPISGNAQTGAPPAVPEAAKGCAAGPQAGLSGPTWAPDGEALAWAEKNPSTKQDEIWVKRQADVCDVQPALAIPGGSAPDWGPADVNPAPRGGGSGTPRPDTTTGTGTPSKPGTPGTPGGPGDAGKPAASAAITVPKTKLAAALRSGLKVRVRGLTAWKQTFLAKRGRKTVAKGTGRIGAEGAGAVTLRFTPAAKRTLRRVKTLRLTITGAGTSATVTLKR